MIAILLICLLWTQTYIREAHYKFDSFACEANHKFHIFCLCNDKQQFWGKLLFIKKCTQQLCRLKIWWFCLHIHCKIWCVTWTSLLVGRAFYKKNARNNCANYEFERFVALVVTIRLTILFAKLIIISMVCWLQIRTNRFAWLYQYDHFGCEAK